jgi:hypothetical protein
MGRSLVKRPDGLYSLYSSIVDDYVLTGTVDELIDELVEEQRFKIQEEIKNAVKLIDGGDRRDCWPCYTTKSWEDAEKTRKFYHEMTPEEREGTELE